MNIKELLGDRAASNKDFTNLITIPTQEELSQIRDYISQFVDITSIDFIPSSLLPLLSEALGYDYIETEDEEVQREILKRLLQEYHSKGLGSQIEKTVNRGFSDDYVLGDLTYYNSGIEEGYSSLIPTRDSLFRYDYSKWDWKRWPDNDVYREGVIEILASKFNDNTIKKLEDVLPAGIKYVLEEVKDIDSDLVDYKYFLYDNIDIWIIIDLGFVEPYANFSNVFKFDESIADNSIFDGRLVVFHDICAEWNQYGINNIIFPNNQQVNLSEVMNVKYSDNEDRLNGIMVDW